MEINNYGPQPNIQFQRNSSSQATGNVGSGQAANGTNDVHPARLIERLEGDVSVRQQRLVDVEARFQAGEFSTRAAAATRIISASGTLTVLIPSVSAR